MLLFRFKNSDALQKEVTRLVRNNPVAVSHIPAALHYLVTVHSVEADAPEVCSETEIHTCTDVHTHTNAYICTNRHIYIYIYI